MDYSTIAKMYDGDYEAVRTPSGDVGFYVEEARCHGDPVLELGCGTGRDVYLASALVGPKGRVIGIDRFGQSAPAGELFEHFGFTVGNVVAAAKEVLA